MGVVKSLFKNILNDIVLIILYILCEQNIACWRQKITDYMIIQMKISSYFTEENEIDIRSS